MTPRTHIQLYLRHDPDMHDPSEDMGGLFNNGTLAETALQDGVLKTRPVDGLFNNGRVSLQPKTTHSKTQAKQHPNYYLRNTRAWHFPSLYSRLYERLKSVGLSSYVALGQVVIGIGPGVVQR